MNWNELSIQEKADLIKLYVANGITSLDTIKDHYNSFQEGGATNNKSDWAKAHGTQLTLQQLGWGNPNNKLRSDYAAKDDEGYYAGYNLKPVTVRPSVQQQLIDIGKNNPKAYGIVEQFDPEAVKFNNQWGLGLWAILAGIKAPELIKDATVKGFETLNKVYNPTKWYGAGLTAATAAKPLVDLTSTSNYTDENGRYHTGNFWNNADNFASDVLFASPAFSAGKQAIKTNQIGQNVINFAKNWRLTVPEDASRYYRIVDNRAIDDAMQSGVIRGPGATEDLANVFRQSVKSETHSPLLIKAHEYPMFAKGKPWQGSTARIDKGKPSIIRSKEDTGPIVWQESNKDFRHKGHAGIFRPSFFGDLNSSPTQYFEYWEPKRFGYLRHDFTNKYPYLGEYNPRDNTVNNILFNNFLGQGSEQSVFDNGKNVLKLHFDRGYYNLPELLEGSNKIVENRNLVSEQLPISLKGYVVDNSGRKPLFHSVYSQEKVNPVDLNMYKALLGDLNSRLAHNGWELLSSQGTYINKALNKHLVDVSPQNLGLKDDKLYIIDGDVYKDGGYLGYITPYGQWQYPHQITTIPSNNITMKGVDYPVIGVSNTGDTKIMFPDLDYTFNGNYVTEYPINK